MNQKLEPAILTIFGATGSLSRERLLPALHHLHCHGLLPKKFSIIGFARSPFTHEEFREKIKPDIRKHSSIALSAKTWKTFSEKIFYVPGDFTNPKDFKQLAKFLEGRETRAHSCANRLFYFATLPSHYETISEELHRSGLLIGCAAHHRKTRVIVEKPFGSDLKTAQKLDRSLNKHFAENQIYRIDHYLGKETVQNLLTVRFANSIFEPIWNHNYIDHIQISSMETAGIGNRGAFYEQTGALRDVMQNHLMQLLALIAMEKPTDLSADAIRDQRVKVIRAIRVPTAKELAKSLVIGQYDGYRREPKISARSQIDTYAAVKLFVDNGRWAGVPFYLRTGKSLKQKISEISVHFKPAANDLFKDHQTKTNTLVFRIQPNEGIFLNVIAKYPGFGIRLHPVTMELGYHSAFRAEIPEAYERLLLDFIEEDQRLFARSDEIESSWQYIDRLEKYIRRRQEKPAIYKPQTWGPKTADKLIQQDHRNWQII